MSTTSDGRLAEEAAAQHLIRHGFKVLERNWRTRYCEIDLVAQKDDAVYFVEVKYRGNLSAGSGLEYITASKLRQMSFAARFWVAQNDWAGTYMVSAVEVAEPDFSVTEFIESLT